MRVLVTGGDGFIGRAVAAELKQRGHDVDVYGLAEGGIQEATLVEKAVARHHAVIHLAGLLGTHELFDQVRQAIDINVVGTVNVLDACRNANAAYVGVTMPQVFPSVYTATKVCATRLATAYHHTYGLPVSHVRAFNVFGPGQAHGPGHPQKIIPTFATEAWAGKPIPIWGDGEQTVDLIHVDQVARVMVDALDYGDDVTFDAGTGEALTVKFVAEFVAAITGSDAGIKHLPMRRGETPTQIVAEGEGWDRLDQVPKLNMRDLADTIRAYKP